MSAFLTSSPLPLRHVLTFRSSICSRRRSPLCTATASNPSETPNSPPSEFRTRFGELRGKAVEPVSATVARFNASFARPVPIVYRAIINELLTTSHLAIVCAMWRFDAIFAYGFAHVFSHFLRYYPNEQERDYLYKCCAQALGFDVAMIRESAAAVEDWIQGKTEEDVFSAVAAASPGANADTVGPVVEALAYVRDAGQFDWYYSRLFGIGMIALMDKAGVELSAKNAQRWAEQVGMESTKLETEMGTYLSSMERLTQAEQIFAEATAREAKKKAERLTARAEAAVREAEELERVEGEKVEDKASST